MYTNALQPLKVYLELQQLCGMRPICHITQPWHIYTGYTCHLSLVQWWEFRLSRLGIDSVKILFSCKIQGIKNYVLQEVYDMYLISSCRTAETLAKVMEKSAATVNVCWGKLKKIKIKSKVKNLLSWIKTRLLIQTKDLSCLDFICVSRVLICSPLWELMFFCRNTQTMFWMFLLKMPHIVSPSGEPSPPAVHGQRGMGKAYRLGLVKQDDGGMPIVEYIVKYKTVSSFFIYMNQMHTYIS